MLQVQSATSTLLDALQWLGVSVVCVLVTLGGAAVLRRPPVARRSTLALSLVLVFVAGSVLLVDGHGYDARVPSYSGFVPTLFALFFYFYAERRYLSTRARWLGLLYVVTIIGQIVNPAHQSWPPSIPWLEQVFAFGGNVATVLLVCSAPTLQVFARARRPVPPDNQPHASWLMRATRMVGIGFLALLLAVAISPPDATTPVPPPALLVVRQAILALLALLPVAAAFALARGQRYDLSALVRRGTFYGVLAVMLAAVYAASFIAIHLLFPLPPALELNLAGLFITVTALLLIAAGWALRPWLRAMLDRRFFRHAHAATMALEEFQAALHEPLAPPDLYVLLATTVSRIVTPQQALLWGRITANEAARIAERTRAAALAASPTDDAIVVDEVAAPDGTYLLQLYAQPESAVAPVASVLTVAPRDPFALTLAPEIGPVALAALPSRSVARHALLNAGVVMALPLARPAGTVGLLGLGLRAGGADYSFDDREFLAACAELAAPPLYEAQARLAQEADERDRERVDQELRTAQRIQRALLPKEMPTIDGWRIATYYQPAREVGGDFYDFLPLPGGRLGLVLGDVSGKGIPAALVMATTRSMLRAVAATADEANPPGAVLRRVNQLLCGDLPGGTFVTCFYGLLDPASGILRFANAGQDLPALRRADGSVGELRATGMPLGLMPESEYEEREAQIDTSASVLLYSDGLVEAHNAKREMFGVPRLAHAIATDAGHAPAIPALLHDVSAFTGATWEQEDDITLVALERAPGAESVVVVSTPESVTAP